MTSIRERLRRTFDAAVSPLAGALPAVGVTPNVVTTVGTGVVVAAAVAYARGAVSLGGGLLLLSGVFDMLDGAVARRGGQVSRFGAFYDSTLDRIGDGALFSGIALFFLQGGIASDLQAWAVGAALVALSAGMVVSYARARAEGLGLECRVGIAQRAERMIGLGAPTLFFGAGPNGWLLLGLIALLALLGVVTVVQRIVHVYHSADARADLAEPVRSAAPDLLLKGRSGD